MTPTCNIVEDTGSPLPLAALESEINRDMDLIRDILLAFDADPKLDGRSLRRGRACELFEKDGVSEDNIAYGLRLLMDRSFVIGHYDKISGEFDIERLSMDGHDFLDSIRDPDACGTKPKKEHWPLAGSLWICL